MPTGTYLVTTDDGRELLERFTCASGPAGWRYSAAQLDRVGTPVGKVDLVVARGGVVARLELESGERRVRAGVVGDEVVWSRDGREAGTPAVAVAGESPGLLVATARLLALEPDAPRRLGLLRIAGPALAGLAVEEGWVMTGVVPHDGVDVERFEVADLASGDRKVVHLVGDVVVGVEGERPVDLLELDGAPTFTQWW